MASNAQSSDRIGIEFLTVFGLPPVEYVNLAADLGCRSISVGLFPMPFNPHGYAPWSLQDDAGLRRDMKAALRDCGVVIGLGEGFTVREGSDVSARTLDLMAELGAKLVNTVSMDPDLNRTLDQFGKFAEMAAAVGLPSSVEFGPGLTISDLPSAVAAVRHVGRPDFGVLIDTMHFVRSGSSIAELATLPPEMIKYVQICDAPLQAKFSTYMEEAMFHRLPPGAGELPLAEIVAVLPRDLALSLEVPQLSLVEAGVGPADRLRPCIDGVRGILAQLN